MPDAADNAPFLQAAARPLEADPEAHVLALQQLEEALAAGKANPAAQAKATAYLSAPAGSGFILRRLRQIFAGLVAASLIAAIVWVVRYEALEVNAFSDLISALLGKPVSRLPGGKTDDQWMEERLRSRLSREDQLWLMILPGESDRSMMLKALWDASPDRADLFSFYSQVYYVRNRRLPHEFLETAGRLDPDNGWFPLLAAGAATKDAVKASASPGKAKGPRNFEVTDEAGFENAWTLLHQSLRCQRFESYKQKLTARQIEALPAPQSNAERFGAFAILMGSPLNDLDPDVSPLFAIKAKRLADAGDRDGMKELLVDWQTFVDLSFHDAPASIAGSLGKTLLVRRTVTDMAPCLEKVGMVEEAKAMLELRDAIRARLKTNKTEQGTFPYREAGVWAGLTLPTVGGSTGLSISAEELKPGRMAEHEMLHTITMVLLAVAMALIALVIALYRFRGGLLLRRLTPPLDRCLTTADWCWILLGGVALPILLVSVLIRTTPFGGWNWTLGDRNFLLPVETGNLLAWLLTILPLIIARWRLGRALGFMAIRWRGPWLEIALLLALVTPQLLTGWSSAEKPPEGLLTARKIAGNLAALWFLLLAIAVFFSRREKLLKRVMLARTLWPAYGLATLLLLVAMVHSHRMESYWLQKDTLMGISAAEPAPLRYEYRAASSLNGQLLDYWEDFKKRHP